MPGFVRRPVVVWLLAALAVPVLLTAVLIPSIADTEDDQSAPAAQTSSSTPSPTEARAESSMPPFEVGRTDSSIRVRTVVKDQAVKDAIATDVDQVLGPDREFDNRITVDAATGLADAAVLSSLLHALAIGTGDASVRYDGTTVTLTGEVPEQATKATVARAAAKAVPGAVIADQMQVPAQKPEVSEPCRTFQSRLSEFTRQHTIIFLSGTSIVNNASKSSVVRAATLLKSCPTVRVELAGHTDNLGSAASSLPLSEQRAAAVKRELVRLGVAADRMLANGYGESFPVASNGTAAGRIANRRVQIRVI
ncbi:OmpA family protein [Kribbella sp. NPDC050281]|uniref:channel-forming protein ArfA/OmpATb n=1 Tax=Kribbella sp. NPDC050281 TaxID=3155515 RepID=UPI0033E74527